MKRIFIIAIFIVTVGLGSLFLIAYLQQTHRLPPTSYEPFIECFINGVSVQTTKENCQKLSIQEPPVINVEQPRPQIQIPVVQPPEPPTRCKTQYFMGSPEIVCEKSWF